MTDPADVAELRAQLREAGADLEHFDVAVVADDRGDARAWAEAGVTWLLTQLGPYRLNFEEALEAAAAGPRGDMTNNRFSG